MRTNVLGGSMGHFEGKDLKLTQRFKKQIKQRKRSKSQFEIQEQLLTDIAEIYIKIEKATAESKRNKSSTSENNL